MLLQHTTLAGLREGRVDRQFRVWKRPTVKTGGRLTTSIGVLRVLSVEIVKQSELTVTDARRAGFETKRALLDRLRGREGRLYCIRLAFEGEDPRIALRAQVLGVGPERDALTAKLARMDAASGSGPWTEHYLRLIGDSEGVRAPDLAEREGMATAPFKARVRRLKALGLTESLRVGYRLSPRGRSYLEG